PHGVYRCRDDERSHAAAAGQNPDSRERWIAIAVRNDDEWSGLLRVAAGSALGSALPSDERFGTILGRRRHEDDLDAAVSAWVEGEEAVRLASRLQDEGVPASLVQDAEDVLDHDAHLEARGYYRYLDHPETERSAYDGPVAKLHRTPGELLAPAPLLGEHTLDVATRILGYSEEEVSELVAAGVLA
ncbi:MAG: CoA transferase, partial [Chloroflexi bacterium]|nr:CoA transferase [Chloroflexota bacterium]